MRTLLAQSNIVVPEHAIELTGSVSLATLQVQAYEVCEINGIILLFKTTHYTLVDVCL